MDSPESDLWRLGAQGEAVYDNAEWLRGFSWRLGHAAVDHVMDNYSLRDRTAPMAARADTETATSVAHADVTLGLRPSLGY